MAKTYNIYQNGVKVQEGVAELTKTITGLTPNTSYKFEVTAVEEGVESEKSTAVTAKTNPRKVATVTASQKTMSLASDGSKALTFSVAPEDATNKALEYTNSNPEFATYSEGMVKAVAAGTTTITATATDGSGVSASCVVTVQSPAE